MQAKQKRRVGVYMEENVTTFSLDLLDGVRDYASEAGWQILAGGEYARTCGVEQLPDDPADWDVAGAVMTLQRDVGCRIADGLSIPFVNFSSFGFSNGYPSVLGDYREHGRLAATHLVDCGIRTLMFVGYLNRAYSVMRCEEFAATGRSRGAVVTQCAVNDLELNDIAQIIAESPKPLGIMTDVDRNGSRVVELCHRHGFRVPEEVAVVGVNNDRYICPFTDPPLSSVDPNVRRIGYCAAEELDRLMRGESYDGPVWVKSAGLVSRGSSETIVRDEYVAAALELIQTRNGGLSVPEISSSVGLSRRALEKRFRDELGESPGEMVRRYRLSVVKRLLAETDMPLKEIAERADFSSIAYLSTAFKKAQGQTLLEYRQSFR